MPRRSSCPQGHLSSLPIFVLFILLSGALVPVVNAAEPISVPMLVSPPAPITAASQSEPPVRVAEGFGVAPMAELVPARVGAVDELEAVAAYNRSGERPIRTGFQRPLPTARSVRFDSAMTGSAGVADGGAYVRFGAATAVWGSELRVEEAYRLRVHLAQVSLPRGARLWVYGEDGEVRGPFGLELVYDGGLWTPSVAGPAIRLEVELPGDAVDRRGSGDAYGFVVDRVMEAVRLDSTGSPLVGNPVALPAAVDTSCIVDSTCVDSTEFPVIDLARAGVAQLLFIEGPFQFACSGGLLNDLEQTATPNLLTANHCFSTQAVASTLEAVWDWTTTTCNGSAPPRSGQPVSNGAMLLATGISSDYTLVELNSVPAGRTFLGWTSQDTHDLPLYETYHRLHYPAPEGSILPQRYTQFNRIADADINLCGVDPEGRHVDDTSLFLHTVQLMGGDFGGSSGGPIIRDNGQVVGQLFGACGPAPEEGCDDSNDNLDGAFANTIQDTTVQAVLLNQGDPDPPSTSWLTTAEQPGFEFQVQITPAGSSPVLGAKEADCIVESLCASGALAGRPEVFVKLIGPRPNGFLWVQISRFTPSQVEVWVRQMSTDETNYYNLPAVDATSDDVSGLQDRLAFSP